MQRKRPTKTSDPSIVMTMTTKKTRAHRSSPTSNSKEAAAADDAEEGAAEAEAGVEEGVAEGGAGHSAAEGGVSAAAAASAADAASAGDEGSADVAGASVDPGVASTAASPERTARCVRARTAVASLAPSRLSTYSTRQVVSPRLLRTKTWGCICLLRPAKTTLLTMAKLMTTTTMTENLISLKLLSA